MPIFPGHSAEARASARSRRAANDAAHANARASRTLGSQDLKKWLPFRRPPAPTSAPFTCRLIVFPYAGATASTMRTITKTLPGYVDVWCIQPPGKETREDEKQLGVCRTIAEKFVEAAGPELDGNPLPTAFFGHSVGSWLAWEAVRQLDAHGQISTQSINPGKSFPFCMFVSTFPAPTISKTERPWQRSRNLGKSEFQEELRRWEPGPELFRPMVWKAKSKGGLGYEKMLRIDCRLYDEYVYRAHHEDSGSRRHANSIAATATIAAAAVDAVDAVDATDGAAVVITTTTSNNSVLVGSAAIAAASTAATTWKNAPPSLHLIMATEDKVVTRDHLNDWCSVLPSALAGTAAAAVGTLEVSAGHQYLTNPQHAATVMQHIVRTLDAHLQTGNPPPHA